MTEKGAMRAAEAITTCRVPLVFEEGAAALNKSVGDRARAANLYAAIIDRETGSPLMLEALRQAATDLEAAAEYFDDASREHVVLMRLAAKARSAIAAAENGDSQQGIARTQRDS